MKESATHDEEDVADDSDDIDLELKEQIENLHIDMESEKSDDVLVQVETAKETTEEESDDTESEGS